MISSWGANRTEETVERVSWTDVKAAYKATGYAPVDGVTYRAGTEGYPDGACPLAALTLLRRRVQRIEPGAMAAALGLSTPYVDGFMDGWDGLPYPARSSATTATAASAIAEYRIGRLDGAECRNRALEEEMI